MTRPRDDRPETLGCSDCRWHRYSTPNQGFKYTLMRECTYHRNQRMIRALEGIGAQLLIVSICAIFTTFFLLVLASNVVSR